MPALDRAFTLAQVNGVAMAVANNLDLDVPRFADVAFQVDGRVAEGRARRLVAALDRRGKLVL